MAIVRTSSGQVMLYNANHLFVTPYFKDNNGNWVLPSSETDATHSTYDIAAIVADTISIEQDDNDVQSKDWEFGDTPVLENITLGKINFSATCIDFQNRILKDIFGWSYMSGDNNGSTNGVFAPSQYSDMYVAIAITFADANSPVVVLPKVKLNAKTVISTLKTGSAEGQISGTAYTAVIGNGADDSAANYTSIVTTMGLMPSTTQDIYIAEDTTLAAGATRNLFHLQIP